MSELNRERKNLKDINDEIEYLTKLLLLYQEKKDCIKRIEKLEVVSH